MNYNSYYQPNRPTQQIVPTPSRRRPFKRHLVRGGVLLVLAAVGVTLFNANFTHAHANTEASITQTYSKPQTVCLDPGHGGDDPGASSNDGSITERDINLTVAQDVQQILEKDGYRVFMTRTTNDVTLSNNDRYTYCNNQHATIMVSIHHNYFQDSSVDYAAALYYKDQDQALATSILDSVATKLGLQNDGISQFDDGVLSESTMPAALSEGFFITNDDEFNQLTASGSTRLSDEAEGIASGITNYFTESAAQRSVVTTDPQEIQRDDAGGN